MSDVKEFFSLEAMINKDETKVLFAKVDNEFADVLLSFLTLPLGTIVRLLKKHYGDEAPILGSLNTLYNSVANLNISHYSTEAGKQMLLNPRSSFEAECRQLKLNLDDSDPTKYYTCRYVHRGRCDCLETSHGYEVFAIKRASYLITDDMRMLPNVTGSIIQTLSNLGINDIHGATQRTVTLGFNEIMELLKNSLLSRTPITDIILHKRRMTDSFYALEKCKSATLLHLIEKEATSSDSEKKKMSLKVMVQKSTNKFLFAQAQDDFIDFLFSFLTIPLGGVECLLGGDTCLRNIDNLYRSAANLDRYLKTQCRGNSILNPEIPSMYLSEGQFLPLVKTSPLFYYQNDQVQNYKVMRPEGKASFVVGTGMYMVTDDLTVTPLCILSSLSLLKELNIPLSDVEELPIDVGLNEALSILKASLTCACALTNALNPILRKQPK